MKTHEKQNPVYSVQPYTGEGEAEKVKGLKFLLVLLVTAMGAFATAAFVTFAAATFITGVF